MNITAYDIAQRFVGIDEVPGRVANPQIMSMLRLDSKWPEDDSVPWCSAFVNYVAWLLRLPRSKSLRARSWLGIGEVVTNKFNAKAGYDVAILSRGKWPQPGPGVLDAPGHVGFFSGYVIDDSSQNGMVSILGGNQNNTVNIITYPESRLLGIRRLKTF
jgi:uncharacterized protein (TIGR02594 family)